MDNQSLNPFNNVVGDYGTVDMLELRLQLMALGADVSNKSDEECLELAQKICLVFHEAVQKFADAIIPFAIEAFNKISEAFAPFASMDYPMLTETVETQNEDKRQRAKQDIENKRRMQRGGKWKAF